MTANVSSLMGRNLFDVIEELGYSGKSLDSENNGHTMIII